MKNFLVKVTESFYYQVRAKNEEQAHQRGEAKWLAAGREDSWQHNVAVESDKKGTRPKK